MLAAAGPFTTSDSLEMEPLRDLLRVVEVEKPDVLLLVCLCVHICVCVNYVARKIHFSFCAAGTIC